MARLHFVARLALPALVIGSLCGSARADVVTTFTGVDPFQTADVSATRNGTTRSINDTTVGVFNFVVTNDGGTGLGPTIRSFCADFFQDVSVGNPYTFTPVAFSALPDVNGNATKISKVTELYDRYYDVATTPQNAAAFQLALWEILYDPTTTNLSSGNFRASDNPGAISLAQGWLNTIGNPGIPDPARKYNLTGLLSATGQDQIVPSGEPIPAPAGVVLLAIGAVGLVVRRRLAGKKQDAVAPEAVA